MELKAYLRTLAKRWRIILITLVVTYMATLILTVTQPPVYRSTATYVVKLSPAFSNDKDFTSAVDTLSRRTEIATTYTIVANSDLLKDLAAQQLGLSPQDKRSLAISSAIIPGTNVLEISVSANKPTLARDFTNAIGAGTIAYTRDLYPVYRLDRLDEAELATSPASPNTMLNLALGGVLGLMLGVGMAFFASYLQSPAPFVTNMNVFDNSTRTYSKPYFMLRLREELSRARHNGSPFTLALLNIDHQRVLEQEPVQRRTEALRLLGQRLQTKLLDEDLLTYFHGSIFVLLLPPSEQSTAEHTLRHAWNAVTGTPLDLEQSGGTVSLHCAIGGLSYTPRDHDEELTPNTLLAKTMRALKRAEMFTQGWIYFLPENEVHVDASEVADSVIDDSFTARERRGADDMPPLSAGH